MNIIRVDMTEKELVHLCREAIIQLYKDSRSAEDEVNYRNSKCEGLCEPHYMVASIYTEEGHQGFCLYDTSKNRAGDYPIPLG